MIRNPRNAVGALFILSGAIFGIWASRIPAIVAKHELGSGELGTLLLLLAAGAIASFPTAGRCSDQFGANKVAWILGVMNVLALILVSLATNLFLLALALFVFGAIHGSLDIAMNSWGSEVERRAKRSMMAFFHAMFSLGGGLGAASGFFAVEFGLGLFEHFLLSGAFAAIVTLTIAHIEWEPDKKVSVASVNILAIPKGALLTVGIVAFCAAVGEGAMADWSGVFLVEEIGLTESKAALGFAAFSASMVVMRLLGDRAIARFGSVNAARGAGAIAALGAVVVAAAADLPTALIGFALLGLGYAAIFPLAFSRAANDPDTPSGAAIASVGTFGYGGGLLGPPAIGFIAEATSLRFALALLALLAIVVIILSRSVQAPEKKDEG